MNMESQHQTGKDESLFDSNQQTGISSGPLAASPDEKEEMDEAAENAFDEEEEEAA